MAATFMPYSFAAFERFERVRFAVQAAGIPNWLQ